MLFATLAPGHATGLLTCGPGHQGLSSLFHLFPSCLSGPSPLDVDECRVSLGDSVPCDHYCHNYLGGYYCSCRAGYVLHQNKHTCSGERGGASRPLQVIPATKAGAVQPGSLGSSVPSNAISIPSSSPFSSLQWCTLILSLLLEPLVPPANGLFLLGGSWVDWAQPGMP